MAIRRARKLYEDINDVKSSREIFVWSLENENDNEEDVVVHHLERVNDPSANSKFFEIDLSHSRRMCLIEANTRFGQWWNGHLHITVDCLSYGGVPIMFDTEGRLDYL